MKQPQKPATFTTDKPILPGFIYLLKQGNVKVCCSKSSLERKGLTGEWEVIREFKNPDK